MRGASLARNRDRAARRHSPRAGGPPDEWNLRRELEQKTGVASVDVDRQGRQRIGKLAGRQHVPLVAMDHLAASVDDRDRQHGQVEPARGSRPWTCRQPAGEAGCLSRRPGGEGRRAGGALVGWSADDAGPRVAVCPGRGEDNPARDPLWRPSRGRLCGPLPADLTRCCRRLACHQITACGAGFSPAPPALR